MAPGRSSHARSDKYVMGYTATLTLGSGACSVFPTLECGRNGFYSLSAGNAQPLSTEEVDAAGT